MIRPISIVCAVVASFVAVPIAWAAVPGDCNGDGIVDDSDVEIAREAVGTTEGDEGYVVAADVNGDGLVSIVDLSEILNSAR